MAVSRASERPGAGSLFGGQESLQICVASLSMARLTLQEHPGHEERELMRRNRQRAIAVCPGLAPVAFS